MVPIMYFFQGNLAEVPQRTHVWNNQKFQDWRYPMDDTVTYLCPGDDQAILRGRGLVAWFRFHAPILGGWRRFHVLEPIDDVGSWHVGWHNWDRGGNFAGVSLIPLRGPVRVLMGPGPIRFLGSSLMNRK